MKKFIFLYSLYTIVSVLGFGQVNLTLGLKAHYTFNGNANDNTTNGFHGSPQGGIQLTTDRFGNANSAYLFDGVDDRIIVTDNGGLSTPAFSICYYFMTESTAYQNSIGKINYTDGNAATYNSGIFPSSPKLYFATIGSSNNCSQIVPGTLVYTIYSPDPIQINQWNCVVNTFENGVEKMYLNGILVSQSAVPFNNATFCTNTNFVIGSWWQGDPKRFKGKMDDIRFYDRAINIDEVNALCETTNPTSCTAWLNTTSAGSSVKIGDLDISGNKITVEAQFNRTAPYSGNYLYAGDIVSKHGNPNSTNYLLRPNSAEITTTNGYFATPAICLMELDKTYHVAMVYDGTTLKFYRNGFLMSQVPATGNLFQNDNITTIGDYAFGPPLGTNFQGYINEVRIWNVARTQAQMQTYLNTSLANPGAQTGLQAYYTFDNLLNKQGNPAWNGTLNGAATINNTNPGCNFVADSCQVVPTAPCDTWLKTQVAGESVKVGDLDVSGNQITVEGTFNCTAFPTTGNQEEIVSKHSTFSDVNYALRTTNGYITTSNGFFGTPDVCNIELNKTYHVAMVYDGASLKYYRNGFLMSQVPATGNLILNNWITTIGDYAYPNPLSTNFYGYINEVRIWNVARTQAQLLTYMNTSLPNPSIQTGLLAYYTFDNLANKQGNASYNGTLTGAATINNTNPSCTFIADSCKLPCDTWLKTTTTGDYVTVGDLDVPGNKLTVEANFNRTAAVNPVGGYGFLVSKHTNPTNVNYALWPGGCSITTVNGQVFAAENCAFDLNKTYHVAMVYDGATLKYYRDGFLHSQTPVTGNLILNDLLTSIAQNSALGAPVIYPFIGNMNEVRIWNVARTKAQLQTYMNSSLPGPATQAGLLGYYVFDNLTNKQGNATYNGSLIGGATINATNPNCSFVPDSCNIIITTTSFTAPDTVCVNTPVQVVNTSTGTSNQYWTFCETSFSVTPVGTNLGNPGTTLNLPVFTDLVKDDLGNYYGFTTNNLPAGVTRYSYGTSLLNTPVVTFLGNPGGALPGNAEGIQVVKANGNWFAIIVGGDPPSGTSSAVAKLSFGTSLANAPTGTNWGNIGNLNYPIDLYLFTENNNWYGYTVNFRTSTITRFDFGADFSTAPTGINLGNIGGLAGPVGIGEIKNNGSWHLFITNEGPSNTLTRLDFGTSLNNTPTGINIGNPGNLLNKPRDISFIKLCEGVFALAVNAVTNNIVKFDFQNNLLAVPTASSLGNLGNLSFPHAISELFRENGDIYALIPNVNSNSITRIQFPGCTGVPGSSLQNPGPIVYSQAGIYNINLITDIGLPTQNSFCRKVVVQPCSQGISNIINDYSPVLAFNLCDNKITVEDASEFNVGDTLLMIQMKGAIINSIDAPAFGTVTDYKNSGNYEFNYVNSKAGNTIELKNKLIRQYDIPVGKVQLIRVPYYTSITVNDTLTSLPWDGSKGGVLAFNVRDTLTLNAEINVSGNGFRGGQATNTSMAVTNCSTNGHFYPDGSLVAAPKGESIAVLGNNILNGKGSAASGGGGGNDHNSGGGGGANAGNGGRGGYQNDGCPIPLADNRGIPGRKLTYTNAANKIFLGAGGGAGHCNAIGGINLNGANGGGLVIIQAPTLISNGFKIVSNGANAIECTSSNPNICSDGAGGGGAGGTILLNINTFTNNTQVFNKGGNGGSIYADITQGRVGPGGGGGGGITWLTQAAMPGNVVSTNTGGANGAILLDGNNAYGAATGQIGQDLFNLVLPIGMLPFVKNIDSVRIKDSLTVCFAFDFNGFGYTNTNPVASWNWYFGDGGTANTQNTSHTYSSSGTFLVKLVITDINGCKDSIIKNVVTNTLTVDAWPDSSFCGGPVTVQLHSSISGSTGTLSWSPAAYLNNSTLPDPTATVNSTTTFYLNVTSGTGCTGKDSVTITIDASPLVQTLPDTAICKGSTLLLSTTTGLNSYHWSPGTSVNDSTIANPVFTDTSSAILVVTGSNTGGCAGTDTTRVTVKPLPVVKAGSDTTICGLQTITLSAAGASTYTWSPATFLSNPNSPNPVFSGNTSTTYYLTGIAANGCQAKDTVQVNVSTAASLVKPPAKSFCKDGSVQLDGSNGNNVQYLWSPATYLNDPAVINPIANPPASTSYSVTISDAICNYDSTFIVAVNVLSLPNVQANKSNDINCADTESHLTASGAIQYSWTPTATLSSSTSYNPVATPSASTLYIVTGTDNAGCSNTDSIKVIVQKGLYLYDVPNSFTPNGDDKNECFGVKHWENARNLLFSIYNRWGEKVFQTNNINVCWDGTYRGKKADVGAYIYHITATTDCGDVIRTGTVLLFR